MSSFFDFKDEDLVGTENLKFTDKEIVKFQCIDFNDNAAKASLKIKCKVLAGEHAGKMYNIYLTTNDNEVSAKIKAQFFRAFWTPDEMKTRQMPKGRLIGRFFTAKCSITTKNGKDGTPKTYTNWGEFQDFGPGDPQTGQPVQPINQPPAAVFNQAPGQTTQQPQQTPGAPNPAQQTSF